MPEDCRRTDFRYNIGAVLFERTSWLDWGMFPVDGGNGLGADEENVLLGYVSISGFLFMLVYVINMVFQLAGAA